MKLKNNLIENKVVKENNNKKGDSVWMPYIPQKNKQVGNRKLGASSMKVLLVYSVSIFMLL